MSDEEKKAIQMIKNQKEEVDGALIAMEIPENYIGEDVEQEYLEWQKNADIILNLIEKQQKEIEHQKEKRENQKQELAILNEKQKEFNKLVNTVNSYKGQFKRQQKEIEELKAISEYREKIIKGLGLKTLPKTITGFRKLIENNDKKWEDKIKAKIEEIDEVLKGQLIEKIRVYFEAQKEVLQSLLGKE